MAILFGVALIVLMTIISPPPSMQELVPVEGTLVSYDMFKDGDFRSGTTLYGLIQLEGHRGRYWNDALKGRSAGLLRDRIGARVRVLYQPGAWRPPMAGDAVKSYGLWVDGRELATAADALNFDRAVAFIVMPVLALCIIGFGCLGLRNALRTG